MMCSSLDLSKPVQTRGGRAVRIVKTDLKGAYPILGIVHTARDFEIPKTWTCRGWFDAVEVNSEDDLVNVPDRPTQHCRTLFVAARGTKVEHFLHYCPEDARKAFPGATAIIEVALDWKDGDGIEESL